MAAFTFSRGWFLVALACTASRAQDIPLTDSGRLDFRNTQAEMVSWRGRQALKLTAKARGTQLAIVRNRPFHDGTIEVDLAGALSRNAVESDRGFIGIAFHMAVDRARYECIYIRPTNGRARDQLRRNHATQYESLPDWPWSRLRRENTGVYESYADMAEGEWIHVKIAVHGVRAELYLAHAVQPCLLVNDLKLGDTAGAIALWSGDGTDGYFANLRVSERTER